MTISLATPTTGTTDVTTLNKKRGSLQVVPVEVTVYRWQTDGRPGKQFGAMPADPIRFRCLGTLTATKPKRYRVDLAQTLDWLPDLTIRELRQLAAALALAVSNRLDVEVAPIPVSVIDSIVPGDPITRQW